MPRPDTRYQKPSSNFKSRISNPKFVWIVLLMTFTACGEGTFQDSPQTEENDYVSWVDPFIGTGAHGHTYPGASVPFGMVQLSPDNGTQGWDWVSGYHYSDSNIVGFSHTHLSGTGIGDLCDISLMPTKAGVSLEGTGETRKDVDYLAKFSHDNEEAEPGYYSVVLDDGTWVELTATDRVGMHRYTYGHESPALVVDLGFAINWDKATQCNISIESDTQISGYRLSHGWAIDQRVFFVMQLSHPINGYRALVDSMDVQDKVMNGTDVKAIFEFEDLNEEPLLVKVGLSSSSVEAAAANLQQELPHWDFDGVRANASDRWEAQLKKIAVQGDQKDMRTFYTALYHTHLAPVVYSDLDGSYKAIDGEIHQADFPKYGILSLWDTFRAQNPLLTIVHPDRIDDLVKSMMAQYNEFGLLPVWELLGNETNTMTGYHAIPVITDAIFKGFDGFDHEEAFEAMKASGMQDIRGVSYFKKYGFIPYDLEVESVTKNLEYAFDDWCIAQVAKKLGKTEDYEYFMKRAASYSLLFDPTTGFMRGRDTLGNWSEPFDPKRSEHRVNTDYTEGNAWQHSWFVPHDVQGLINLHGGSEPFVAKLDSLFNESSEITGDNVSVDISGLVGQYAHGNEPSHHIAYLYNYAGVPWKTQQMVRHILESQYDDTPEGLSGNEDCGQMSAWYVLSSLGFYPVNPAEGIYVIGSPLFTQAEIQLGEGKSFKVLAPEVSKKNIYIQSATLNGQPLDRSYILHSELMSGGELEFEMAPEPNMELWSSSESFPPSMSK